MPEPPSWLPDSWKSPEQAQRDELERLRAENYALEARVRALEAAEDANATG